MCPPPPSRSETFPSAQEEVPSSLAVAPHLLSPPPCSQQSASCLCTCLIWRFLTHRILQYSAFCVWLFHRASCLLSFFIFNFLFWKNFKLRGKLQEFYKEPHMPLTGSFLPTATSCLKGVLPSEGPSYTGSWPTSAIRTGHLLVSPQLLWPLVKAAGPSFCRASLHLGWWTCPHNCTMGVHLGKETPG